MGDLPTGKHTIPGSCHCKAIKFTATNVDFSMMAKCNCTLCNTCSRTGIMISKNDITLHLQDGSDKVYNFENAKTDAPPALVAYTPGIRQDGGRVNHHFCKHCGVHVFMTESIPVMPESFINVHLGALDLQAVGLNLRDITNPKTMTYSSGLDDSWARQTGEPFPGGTW